MGMSNACFAFKQFTVQQDQCAMKVSTDACIQGAWTPVNVAMKRVLDVGAGTGLLSMMIAQRLPDAQIDALELNEPASLQAAQNVASSPFATRIQVMQADAAGWVAPYSYDLIICNPPFFKASLTGPDAARNAARHTGTLNPQSLSNLLLQHLSADGVASVMWPPPEHASFAMLAVASGFSMQALLRVHDKAGTRVTRVIGLYSRKPFAKPVAEELIIKSGDGSYTQAFVDLLKPFYLRF
jgi:tRNA1Val (adenine37-N6)-methyltransferase